MKPTGIIPQIIKKVKKGKTAFFDFGSFNIYTRRKGVIMLPSGKMKSVPDFVCVFFTASKILKRELRKLKVKDYGKRK